MLKSNKRRNGKNLRSAKVNNKSLIVPDKKIPQFNNAPSSHQTDIKHFFKNVKDSISLDDVNIPSPDDAALPCSTMSENCTGEEEKKVIAVNEKKTASKPNGEIKVQDKTSHTKKKNAKGFESKDTPDSKMRPLTTYFPVRRSSRKKISLMKEKQKMVEEAILNANEEGFEIHEFPGKGRGVVTKHPLKRGEFVIEYAGELIDCNEAKDRETQYALRENIGCYMYYFKMCSKRYCIDATKESGRLGRLINHSKKGNLKTEPVLVNDTPHLALFASCDIAMGEELLYDYGDRSKKSLISHPWLAL